MRSRTFALAAVFVATLAVPHPSGQSRDRWVGTWAAAQTWRPASPATPAPAGQPATPQSMSFNGRTLRQIVHTSIGGSRVRVTFSNVYGTAPLTIGSASVALRDKDSGVKTGTSRPLVFSGSSSVTIPAGASFVSDAVALETAALSDLAIDVYLSDANAASSSPLTMHANANQANYVSTVGNHVAKDPFPVEVPINSWFFIERVDVTAPASAAAVVTIGDSITDGTRSSLNTNSRWPDELARRLQAQASTRNLSVLNTAISGNRVLNEANAAFGWNVLSRFDRDALVQPGVAFIVVLEGINDIGMNRPGGPPSAAELIGGYQQLIERAHARALKIFGATLLPYEGAAYFSADGETKRQAINQWIRTRGAYDGVIDFDTVTRDPQNPTKLLPAYDSGDHLHPNDAGYKAMGQAVDLGLFR